MPVVRICYYCKKGFLASSYQMLRHAEECKQKILSGHNRPIYLEKGWKESQVSNGLDREVLNKEGVRQRFNDDVLLK